MEMQLDDLGAALADEPIRDEVQKVGDDVFESIRERPDDPRHSLLMALEEATDAKKNPTIIFVGIMAALEACLQTEKWRQISELLGLLVMALPVVASTVLRNKFDLISSVLVDVMQKSTQIKKGKQHESGGNESTTACARQAARSLGTMLSVQDESAWKAPAKRKSIRILLKAAIWETRPKVRKAARAACTEALSLRFSGPSRLVTDDMTHHMRQAITTVTPAAFHVLALLEALAHCLTPECAQGMLDAVAEIALPITGGGFENVSLAAITSLAENASSRKARSAVVRLASHCLGKGDDTAATKWCEALRATLHGLHWRFPDDESEAQATRAALALCIDASPTKTTAVLQAIGVCILQTRETAPMLFGAFRGILIRLIEFSWTAKQPLLLSGMETWFGSGRDLAEFVALLARSKDNTPQKPDEFFICACRILGPALFGAAVGLPLTGPPSNIQVQARLKWLAPCLQQALQNDCNCQLSTFLDQWLPTASAYASIPSTRRECWRPAANFLLAATDLNLSLPRFTNALATLLEGDNSDLAIVSESCHAASVRRSEPAVAAMARSLAPALLGAALTPQGGELAAQALQALAPALEPQVSVALFKKLAKRLVAALSLILGTAAQKKKKKRGRDDDIEDDANTQQEVSTKSGEQLACSLLRAAAALTCGLPDHAQRDVLWRAARPVLEAATVPVGVQKQAYILVQALCADQTWLAMNSAQLAECLASGSLLACHVPVRAVRLRTIEQLISSQQLFDQQLLASLLGEAVLGVKDANAKARKAAFALLDTMAQAVASISALLDMLVAALGARTPHMRSAAMAALAKVAYDRRTEAVLLETLPRLLTAAALLLRDKAREVAKATLAFIAVAISALCAADRTLELDQLLSGLVPALMLWAKEKKGRFRLKVKMILLKLCRNLGFDTILAFVPSDDAALIAHLRRKHSKSKISSKKKKQQKVPKKEEKETEEELLDDDRYFDDFKDEEDMRLDDDDDEMMQFEDEDDHDEEDLRQDLRAQADEDHVMQQHLAIDADDDEDNEPENETDVQFDSATGRIIVAETVPAPLPTAELAASSLGATRPREPRARKLRGKEAAAAKRKSKAAKSDAIRPGQLQPYSWSTLGDLVRSSKKRRKG